MRKNDAKLTAVCISRNQKKPCVHVRIPPVYMTPISGQRPPASSLQSLTGTKSARHHSGGADRGSSSIRAKNGAKAVGRLPPKEPTFLNRPSPSFLLSETGVCWDSTVPRRAQSRPLVAYG